MVPRRVDRARERGDGFPCTDGELEKSVFARRVFGEDVVEHSLHFFRTEDEAYTKAVTDWERRRYFERI